MWQVLVILFLSVPRIADLAPSRDMPTSNAPALLHRDLPSIYSGYKVDPYLAAAAKLQALGKERALKELRRLASEELKLECQGQGHETGCVYVLCRMLFTKRTFSRFMRPGLGGAFFLADTEYTDWPLEPIELVDGVPFCIASGYLSGGEKLPPEFYLDYCIKECGWSSVRFKPLGATEKQKALHRLLTSKKWRRRLDPGERDFLSAQIR